MWKFALPFLAILIASCEPVEDGTTDSGLPPVGAAADAVQQARCEARGGNWARIPSGGGFVCLQATRDAGDFCSDASDCQGHCLARSRTCTPVTPFFGCHDILNAIGAEVRLCLN